MYKQVELYVLLAEVSTDQTHVFGGRGASGTLPTLEATALSSSLVRNGMHANKGADGERNFANMTDLDVGYTLYSLPRLYPV